MHERDVDEHDARDRLEDRDDVDSLTTLVLAEHNVSKKPSAEKRASNPGEDVDDDEEVVLLQSFGLST